MLLDNSGMLDAQGKPALVIVLGAGKSRKVQGRKMDIVDKHPVVLVSQLSTKACLTLTLALRGKE